MHLPNILEIVLMIGGMLLLERLTIWQLCRKEASREWIRRHWILHPNTLSIFRLPMGICSTLIAAQGHWRMATVFFAFWMITDLTDGTIARACDLGSDTGKWLDPLSDKMMYCPVLLFFCFSDSVNIRLDFKVVLAFLLVDVLGQFSRLFVKKTAANMFGKAKTALTTILLSLLAIQQIQPMTSLFSPAFFMAFMYACLLLAFLSAYCKICPDNWYANTFTFANFSCGVLAIIQAFRQHLGQALLLVFIGQFFDLFDGRFARKYGSTKGGPMFDDIADGTSFGLGIGSMVFVCLDRLEAMISVQWAFGIASLYVICLIFRLYRFLRPTEELPPGIFQGLPSPAGALFAGSAVLVSQEFQNVPWTGYIAASLVVLVSLLMVSNIRYCHFGQTIWPQLPKSVRLVCFLLITILCIFAFAHKHLLRHCFVWFCFVLATSYLVYGVNSINRLAPPQPKENAL